MATLAAFIPYIAPEVIGCPEPLIEDAIRRASREFCERSELLREAFDVDTEIDVDSVTLAATGGDVAKVYDVMIDGEALDRTRRDDYPTDGEPGEPQHYYVEGRNTLRLYPIPDAVYTLAINAVVMPTRDANTVDDLLFDDHRDTIAAGAKAILMLMLGVPWFNPDGAELHTAVFNYATDKARTRKAQGGVGAPLRTRAHYF
jgi:hypothetical protein